MHINARLNYKTICFSAKKERHDEIIGIVYLDGINFKSEIQRNKQYQRI